MIFAVAGMTAEEVQAMTQRLSGDWSDLPEPERIAFEFTRKQAQDPASLTDADYEALEKAWGREQAWQIVWWAARCHYMTKVADAFQLTLEEDNPFWAMPGAVKPKK
ncbi:MAG: hypothetical protein N2039_01515 [Gemmataceae bacterium]|nr:hypothetical protein [Gemmataceae bacterium]